MGGIKVYPEEAVFAEGDRVIYHDNIFGYVKEVHARPSRASWEYIIQLDDGNILNAYGEYKLEKY